MSRTISLADVRDAVKGNVECLDSLRKILGNSDKAARDIACTPTDPNCPQMVKKDCRAVARTSGATVLDALEIIQYNLETYVDILELFEGPRVPMPNEWDKGEEAAAAKG